MVKDLQRKYIKTTMLVVTILLAVFLVLVNILNYSLTRSDSRERLNQIAAENVRSMPGENQDTRTIAEPGMDLPSEIRPCRRARKESRGKQLPLCRKEEKERRLLPCRKKSAERTDICTTPQGRWTARFLMHF